MSMDERTAAALEDSIAHWERNVGAETWDAASISGEKCALCSLFWKPFMGREESKQQCLKCPVFLRSGKTGCHGTPYLIARDEFFSWEEATAPFADAGDDESAAREKFRAAARAELEFLESLREPAE